MASKEEVVGNIKDWLKLDGDIMNLQLELKAKKNERKALSVYLMGVMKENKIDCFDINGGSLLYKTNKVKKALTTKSLVAALTAFYATAPEKAEEVTKYVLESRVDEVKESIKRKINK